MTQCLSLREQSLTLEGNYKLQSKNFFIFVLKKLSKSLKILRPNRPSHEIPLIFIANDTVVPRNQDEDIFNREIKM